MEDIEEPGKEIVLIDDEGNEHDFLILDLIKSGENYFYALSPVNKDCTEESEELIYHIFKDEPEEENEEKSLTEVEDPEELEKFSKIFEYRFDKKSKYS